MCGSLRTQVRAGCGFCDDLVSRLADISIGSIGSPDGYSTVIVRSERGEKLLEAVQFSRREINRDEIVKLAAIKKKNADKNFAGIVAGLPERLWRDVRRRESAKLLFLQQFGNFILNLILSWSCRYK